MTARLGTLAALGLVVLVALAATGAVLLELSRGREIGRLSRLAADGRPDAEPVVALSAFALAPDRPLEERNRAIWALGELGDPRALEVLERLRDGRPCDHATRVCQREVEKAMRKIGGELSLRHQVESLVAGARVRVERLLRRIAGGGPSPEPASG